MAMGYLGSSLEDYYPHQLLEQVIKQLHKDSSLLNEEYVLKYKEVILDQCNSIIEKIKL